MKQHPNFLYPRYEEHVRLFCDGTSLHSDGYSSGPDALPLPSVYETGLCAVYHLLESMLPGLKAISVLGIWTEEDPIPFCALDIWLQVSEDDGFYLPMDTAASLFSRSGIPYFHRPLP